jgi:FKBP-type peptidyl-prolyl cis-trans isomerase
MKRSLKFPWILLASGCATACAKLTAPPEPEPISQEQPTTQATVATAQAKPTASAPSTAPAPQAPKPPSNEKLEMKDLVMGKGAEAKAGDDLDVHYVGTLTDGKEFDSSKKRGVPFSFRLGAGRVIKGWDQGVAGMKVGGKRKLVIPPSLGYGEGGSPPVIPPNATLVFEVELVGIKPKVAADAPKK